MNCLKCGQPATELKCPACGFDLEAAGRLVSLAPVDAEGIGNAALNGFHRRLYRGAYYEGEFKDGKPHGFGAMTNIRVWGSKIDYFSSYTGDWAGGEEHGKGTSVCREEEYIEVGSSGQVEPSGYILDTIYTGGFRAGLRHGKGIETDGYGNTFVGEYSEGRRHGEFVLVGYNGRVFRQTFEHGERISEQELK